MLKEKNIPLIDQLNQYIEPVDPEWSERIKPANRELLLELRKYLGMQEAGLSLPVSLIEFAYNAGENDGGIISKTLKGTFSITELVKNNEEIYNFEKENINPYYFEFLTDEMGLSYGVKYDDKIEKGIYYEDTCFVSSSFKNLLFQSAVRLYEEKYYANTVAFGASINSLKEASYERKGLEPFVLADDMCTLYGLKKAWFNDNNFFFAYSDNVSIYLLNQVSISGKISGNHSELIKKMIEYLLPKIGAKIQDF